MRFVKKVWGSELWITNSDKYCGKKLILNRGMRCSLHHHRDKHETFYIHSGHVLMELGGATWKMMSDSCVVVPPETPHRFSGLEDSVIFEFSTHYEDFDSYRVELSGPIPEEIMEAHDDRLRSALGGEVPAEGSGCVGSDG